MAEDDAPKTAYEIIVQRLKAKDREAGVEERPLGEQQRARIAELRKVYQAKLAELEILHQSQLRKALEDPEACEKLEEDYRRERERIAAERDRKLDDARSRRPAPA